MHKKEFNDKYFFASEEIPIMQMAKKARKEPETKNAAITKEAAEQCINKYKRQINNIIDSISQALTTTQQSEKQHKQTQTEAIDNEHVTEMLPEKQEGNVNPVLDMDTKKDP